MKKALLLSAGFGSRLRPLTDSTPKCLVDINGLPLMSYWLDQLSEAGFSEFLVNTHYLSSAVERYFDNSPYKSQVRLAYEKELLGTGGTLLSQSDFWSGEDVLVAHADNLCLCDFSDFIEAHKLRPKNCLITMMLFTADNPQACGVVELDGSIVSAFYEKVENPPSNLANAAVYCFGKDFLPWLLEFSKGRSYLDISLDVIPELIGKIHTWKNMDYMLDIGTPNNYKKANDDMSLRMG